MLKDSGVCETFDTGAVRDSRESKGRFDLISPIALREIAIIYEEGGVKRGDRNWEKGMPLSRYLDSAMRHINDFRLGDTSENHLAQAAWNLFALMHTRALIRDSKLPQALSDLPWGDGRVS